MDRWRGQDSVRRADIRRTKKGDILDFAEIVKDVPGRTNKMDPSYPDN